MLDNTLFPKMLRIQRVTPPQNRSLALLLKLKRNLPNFPMVSLNGQNSLYKIQTRKLRGTDGQKLC